MMLNLSVGVYSLHSGLILEILLPDSTAGATGDLRHTVCLTSIYYRVPGNQELLIAHSETFEALVEKMRTLTWGIV